jgi:flagellar assembly protein FliH
VIIKGAQGFDQTVVLGRISSKPNLVESIQEKTPFELGFESGHREGIKQAISDAHAEIKAIAERESAEVAKLRKAELDVEFEILKNSFNSQSHAGLKVRVQQLENLTQEITNEVAHRLSMLEEDMLAICFEAISKVLGEHEVAPEKIKASVLTSISAFKEGVQTEVRVNPDDWNKITEIRGKELTVPNVIFICDENITSGGCVVKTAHGELDTRIETQLARLKSALLRAR